MIDKKRAIFNLLLGGSALVLSLNALAEKQMNAPAHYEEPHFYVGGSLGYGDNHWNKWDTIYPGETGSVKHKGFVGGINAGYAFNQYLAIEAGVLPIYQSLNCVGPQKLTQQILAAIK